MVTHMLWCGWHAGRALQDSITGNPTFTYAMVAIGCVVAAIILGIGLFAFFHYRSSRKSDKVAPDGHKVRLPRVMP